MSSYVIGQITERNRQNPTTRQDLPSPNLSETPTSTTLPDTDSPDNNAIAEIMTRNIGLKRSSLSAEEDEGRRYQRRKFVACVARPSIPTLHQQQANPPAIVASDATHIRSSAPAINRVASVALLDVLMNVPMPLGIARLKLVRSMWNADRRDGVTTLKACLRQCYYRELADSTISNPATSINCSKRIGA